MLFRILDLYDRSIYVVKFLMVLTPAYIILGKFIYKQKMLMNLIIKRRQGK